MGWELGKSQWNAQVRPIWLGENPFQKTPKKRQFLTSMKLRPIQYKKSNKKLSLLRIIHILRVCKKSTAP